MNEVQTMVQMSGDDADFVALMRAAAWCCNARTVQALLACRVCCWQDGLGWVEHVVLSVEFACRFALLLPVTRFAWSGNGPLCAQAWRLHMPRVCSMQCVSLR
jgi:hypothetical protein